MGADVKNKDVSVEQVKLLADKTPSMAWLTLLTVIIISLVLYGNVATWIPVLLFFSMTLSIFLRLWHHKIMQKNGVNDDNAKIHLAFFVGFAFAGGSIWGMLGLIIPISSDIFLLVLIATLLCGLVAAAVPYLSIYKIAFFAFAIPCIVPFALRCILMQQEIFVAIGILVLLFLLVNLFNSHLTQISVLKGINLEQKNRDLIKSLKYEKSNAEESRKIADHNNAAKSRYLAAASHDLRQPLNAMGFFVEALKDEKDPVEIQHLIARVSQSSDLLRDLIGSLLDMSKIEAGVMEPRKKHFILNDLLTNITQEFADQAYDKGLSLDFEPCLQTVYSDMDMLGRILRNLVSNAVQYTDHGFVNISCDREGGSVAIKISDSGRGIAQENTHKIFQEFYRVSGDVSETARGLGLGLSIVDGLCRLLGHDIKLYSELGVGTVFSIKVPQGNMNMVATTESINLPEEALAKVIILSDEEQMRQYVSEMMRHWGYIVANLASSEEGQAFLDSEDFIPDLIISDLKHNGVPAIEAIVQIQKNITLKTGHEIPVIILAEEEVQERTQSHDLTILPKPVQLAKLRSLASYLVSGNA
ncbi:MAG: ATP-binding protein [Emcibacter sp.]|nr:ATP-binding protein [Emcibacter sp.]